ncbi:MAG: bifunctional phosphoribosylaminoimidazolecarboxamide formyltransferase/IMP cyclohydrolase [Candidatus Brocadiia bacterium]
MAKIKTALISVSDKTGVPEFARRLADLDIEILATGGTARLLRESNVEALDVSDYTGFPEILGGGLRTLHPKVHGGLLASREREQDLRELEELGIRTIDMVVANLFPFIDVISEPSVEMMRAIENIDISGPTLLRSAAKNYTHVAVVTNPATYPEIADELGRNNARLSEETHFQLALDAYRHTAHYDTAIADYLAGIHGEEGTSRGRLTLEYVKKQDLRYGENPHQSAAFYVERSVEEAGAASAEQIGGPEMSFTNVLDVDAGIALAKEFDRPAVIIVRNTIPCGAALSDCLTGAFRKAWERPRPGLAGCTVVFNRPLDEHVVRALAAPGTDQGETHPCEFVETLVAPGFAEDALKEFCRQAGHAGLIRLLRTPPLDWALVDERARDMRCVNGGMLVQDRDLIRFEADDLTQVTRRLLDGERMMDALFAWLCCKHVRSNAAVLAADEALVGVGAGQSDRLASVRLALGQAGELARGAILASDGFLCSTEAVQEAAQAGVVAVIQPGGADNDEEVAEAADEAGIAMVHTHVRHFRH